MFNIKIYDRKNNFLATLSEKEISCDFKFSAMVNSGFSSLKFNYYGKFVFEHREIIKIYRYGKIIYQGFIIGIEKFSDRSGKKVIVEVSGMLGLLAFKPRTDGTYSNDPGVLIRNIFSSVSSLFDTEKIQNYGSSVSLQSSGNTALSFIQEVLKNTSDFGLFINENNEVIFGPYENEHYLTYGKEVYGIEIKEDSSNYYNRFRVNYNGGNIISQNNSEVEKYGESYLVITDTNIRNYQTAQVRINSLFKEYAIKKTIKVLVNNKVDYYDIKPGDIITLRNTELILENKPVKQINYSKDTAIITLESYSSLERFISEKK